MAAGKRTDYLLFLLLAAMWGGSFVAIKFVVREFPPMFGAMLRVAVALAVLAAVFRYEGRSLKISPPLARRMWLAGFFAQGLPFILLFWGERRISPGLAGVINGTVPIWAFLLGRLTPHPEGFTPRKAAGLGLGLAGIAIIFHPLLAFGGTRAEAVGAAAVVLMAVSYGIGALMSRSVLSGAKADFRANVFHQLCASLAVLLAASAIFEEWPAPAALFASSAALVSVLYLGVFSTAAAFLIFYHLIREWGAVRASAVTYVAPVIALFWDFVFFGNAPGPSLWLGVAAILSGVVLLHERESARRNRNAAE
ncbi:MAG: DMT family transporter [Elusimicrobia bacterium]|nr:DMT family transporter [Elusimicrobiota bacterium]